MIIISFFKKTVDSIDNVVVVMASGFESLQLMNERKKKTCKAYILPQNFSRALLSRQGNTLITDYKVVNQGIVNSKRFSNFLGTL